MLTVYLFTVHRSQSLSAPNEQQYGKGQVKSSQESKSSGRDWNCGKRAMAVELGRNHNKQHLLQFSLNTVSIVSVRFTGKVFISTPVSQAKFSISTLEDTEPFHTRGQCRGRPHACCPCNLLYRPHPTLRARRFDTGGRTFGAKHRTCTGR